MPMCYKVDLLAVLKEAGYNTNRIRKEKIMGEAMLQKIRNGRDYTDRSWTAISSAPYLKAIDLWFNGSGWNGGGKFIDEKTVSLCSNTFLQFSVRECWQYPLFGNLL